MNGQREGTRRDTGTVDVAFVLLIVQASIGILSALTMLVFGAFTGALPVMGAALLFAFCWPAAGTILAVLVARLHRWARRGVLLYEGLAFAAWALSLLVSRQDGLQLMGLVSGALLPVAVFSLLWSPSARLAVGARRPRGNAHRSAVPSLTRAA